MKQSKSTSIISDDLADKCYICGRYPQHVHHMLHGSYRKMADKYGLTCHLCYKCHNDLHDKGLKDRELQEVAQEAFEKKYGHDEFMRIFGKNFRRE